MTLKSLTVGLYLGLSAVGLVAAPAQAAPVTFSVSGTFGSTFLAGSASSASYAFPGLFGGSFNGSFTVDDAAPRIFGSTTFSGFDFTNVDIDIVDNTNATVWNIDTGPNRVFVQDGMFQVRFGESFGGDATGNPEDLRLTFAAPAILGGATTLNIAAMSAGNFQAGFSEVDGAASSTFWDLEVASATIEGPAVTEVPEPVPAAVLGFGLAVFALRRRQTRKRAA